MWRHRVSLMLLACVPESCLTHQQTSEGFVSFCLWPCTGSWTTLIYWTVQWQVPIMGHWQTKLGTRVSSFPGNWQINQTQRVGEILPFPMTECAQTHKKNSTVDFTSTPAEASNTATAPSRTLKQRSTSTVKSTWPKKQSSFYSNTQHQQVITHLNNFFSFK